MVSPAMEKKNAESFYLSLEMGTVRENSSKVEFQVRGYIQGRGLLIKHGEEEGYYSDRMPNGD